MSTKLIFMLYILAAIITTAPASVLCTLYTSKNFNCVGTGSTLFWTVEGHTLTDPSNQDREISVTTNNISIDVWSSVLTIRALSINDGISVGCNVLDENFNYDIKGATLTIQGLFLL